MGSPTIDYEALARKNGAVQPSAGGVDYAALAQKNGAVETPEQAAARAGVGGTNMSNVNAAVTQFQNQNPAVALGRNVAEVGLGSAKELGKQGLNVLGAINPTQYEVPSPESFPSLQTPAGPQLAGASVLKAAELFAPTKYINKGVQAIEAMAPGLGNVARVGMEGASAGGITGLQTGNAEQAATAGLVTGGITALGPVLKAMMGGTGQKIRASTIRPRASDVKDGFDYKTIETLAPKGNLHDTFNQVESKLNQLRTQRNGLLKSQNAQPIDMASVLQDAQNELFGQIGSLKHTGTSTEVKRAFLKIKKELQDNLGTGIKAVDVPTAENAKEALGLLGAWAYGRTEIDAAAREKVANLLYPRIRQAIENALPEGATVKALNAEMGKLLPVKHAILARIPVEDRNRIFSLADIDAIIPAAVTGDIRRLALLGLTRSQKSLRVGNWLANNAQSATGAAAGLGKLVTGGINAMTGLPEEEQ